LLEAAAILIGYLLGSIPAPYWIARARKGIDIRTVGVRNMGSANVIREVGKWEGALAAIIDVGKGTAAVWIAHLIGVTEYWIMAAGFAAVLGHNFPIFLKFRGGRGAAAFIGVMLFLSPIATAVSLCIFAVLWLVIHHTFTALAVTSPFIVIAIWLVERSPILILFVVVTILFMFIRSKYRLREFKMAFTRLFDKYKNPQPPQAS
jgi:acyl phosphate:glycerol-3-phosphate acyltransferase